MNDMVDAIDEIKLKYCPRTKHSKDWPLKKATKVCAQKEGRYCGMYPNMRRYIDVNEVELKPNGFKKRFICVLEG